MQRTDFEKVFALHITKKTPSKKGIKDNDIGKFLLAAYQKPHFETTELQLSRSKSN